MERGKERITINVNMPRNRCAHCRRVLRSGERLEATVYLNGGLVTVTICRPCLMEHVPEATEELTRDQPRRFR